MALNEVPSITLSKIDISPNPAPIDSPLKLDFEFTTSEGIENAAWHIEFLVDLVSSRHVVDLGKTTGLKYAKGVNTFTFELDRVDVSSVKEHHLLNVGIVKCTLSDSQSNRDIIEVKLMTQVSKNHDGVVVREVFNPLE